MVARQTISKGKQNLVNEETVVFRDGEITFFVKEIAQAYTSSLFFTTLVISKFS